MTIEQLTDAATTACYGVALLAVVIFVRHARYRFRRAIR